VEEARQYSAVIGYYALGPLGLLVLGLSVWSLYNAWAHGRVRSHGWIHRTEQPGFYWTIVIATAFAGFWFGLIGVFVTADLIGLVQP
jgi:hypothetical protein